MIYNMIILTSDFEQLALGTIRGQLLIGRDDNSREAEQLVNAAWSFCVMHWMGLQSMLGIPPEIDKPTYTCERVNVELFIKEEAPIVTEVPVIDWQGCYMPITRIKRVIACRPERSEDSGENFIFTPYAVITSNAADDLDLPAVLEMMCWPTQTDGGLVN